MVQNAGVVHKKADSTKSFGEMKMSDKLDPKIIMELCNAIRETIITFSKENFHSILSKRGIELTEENAKELATCIEIQFRAICFEMGYTKAMLYAFPPELIEQIVSQEMTLGALQFWKETKEKERSIKMNIDTFPKDEKLN